MTMFGFCKSDPSMPIEYLDYKYIETCTDANQLQKILEILRSGEEGIFPKLEECAEKQLAKHRPNSALLEKSRKEKMCSDLAKEERADIIKNIQGMQEKSSEHGLEDSLPPIRNTKNIDMSEQKPTQSKSSKRITPRSYDEWSKVDQEIEKEEENEKNKTTTTTDDVKKETESSIHTLLEEKVSNLSGKSREELEFLAMNEKKKGNEAFQSGDFKEALVYYNRSLSIVELLPVYNNRAITHIKLKDFRAALVDCNKVIAKEPGNLKAYLRRGLANQALNNLEEAKTDFEKVLSVEPTNKRGKELLEEVTKSLEKQESSTGTTKKKGTRLKVEEIDSSDNTDDVKTNTETLPKQSNGKRLVIQEIDTTEQKDMHTEKEALKSNLKSAGNNVVEDSTQTEQIVRELPPNVLLVKDKGNMLFKSGQYVDALKEYTHGIHELLEDCSGFEQMVATLFSNRAMCEMKIGRCKECIHDCNESIRYYPTVKAFMRRATANETLEKYGDAYVDYQTALQGDYNNQNAMQAISRKKELHKTFTPETRVTNHLKSIHGPSWRSKLPKSQLVDWKTHGVLTIAPPPSSSTQTQKSVAAPKETTINQSTRTENLIDDQKKPTKNQPESPPPGVKRDSEKPTVSSDQKSKLTPAEEFQLLKSKGNTCVQKGDYATAVSFYSKCITILPNEVSSYTNRALCYLKTQQPKLAVGDCTKALELQPDNIKALFRRAQGNKLLGEYKRSLGDLQTVLKKEPNNSAAKTEIDECKQLFRKELLDIQQRNENDKKQQKTEKKGKKMKIEEVTSEPSAATLSSSRKNKNNTKADCCQHGTSKISSKQNLPKKMSAFEFLQSWNSIKSNKSADYADLLKQVDATKLPELFSNKLDGEIIRNFIHAVHDHFTTKELYNQGIQLLKSLSKTPRFVMMLMFLSTLDKTKLKSTIDLLENRVKQNGGKAADINCLRSAYNCS